ncbi:hypothetical protein DL96DRAFT_1681570 [Flagelloscypha sp. PMI_526]|nr:hypothetical protein DL96DRAFT_1681570 [Flagelloscypha sp. PMI_526]
MSDDYLSATLPPELWLKIIFYLSTPDLYRLRTLNASFWRAAWRQKFRQLRLTPTELPPNRWYEKWPSWTRVFMFREIFYKYSQPEVNQALTSLTLSASIETLIWKWRRDFPWLKIPLIILCLPFICAGRISFDNLSHLSLGLPASIDPLSHWSHSYFPAQIVSFAQSLTHITTLELSFLSEPEPGFGTWHYKLPWPHPQPSYFCEVLKCLAPNLLRLSLRNWPRDEEDFTEIVHFPLLKKFIWNPHNWRPLRCLRTLRESLRRSDKLEEIGVSFHLHDETITEDGVLRFYVEELLYPHLRKFTMIWWVRATLIPPDVRQFLDIYRDTIQTTVLNIFQRWSQPDLPTSDEDILSLLSPSKLRSLRVNVLPGHRYERFRSALMASTTLRNLSLVLTEIPNSDNAFAFLPNLSFLKLQFQGLFKWDEPLWVLMRTLPTSLPALKKLEMWNGWALIKALPENTAPVNQAQGLHPIPPKELVDDLSYTQQPYIQFEDSLRGVLEMPRWQSWGLEEIEVGFGRKNQEADQRFIHNLMARCLPQVTIFGGVHRSMLQEVEK